MFITLWQGSAHVRHGTEHLSSTFEVKINIIAMSHFLLRYNYFHNVYLFNYCVRVEMVERDLVLPWSRVTVECQTQFPVR